jgi:hypothetical protein
MLGSLFAWAEQPVLNLPNTLLSSVYLCFSLSLDSYRSSNTPATRIPEVDSLYTFCRATLPDEEVLDPNDKPDAGIFALHTFRGAYHVAAWLNQRRVADSQRPSIGNARGSRREPDGAFWCDHEWSLTAGVIRVNKNSVVLFVCDRC